jgi:hypothetical protein
MIDRKIVANHFDPENYRYISKRYVLPRGLESVWSILRSKSYVPFVPGGDLLLTS